MNGRKSREGVKKQIYERTKINGWMDGPMKIASRERSKEQIDGRTQKQMHERTKINGRMTRRWRSPGYSRQLAVNCVGVWPAGVTWWHDWRMPLFSPPGGALAAFLPATCGCLYLDIYSGVDDKQVSSTPSSSSFLCPQHVIVAVCACIFFFSFFSESMFMFLCVTLLRRWNVWTSLASQTLWEDVSGLWREHNPGSCLGLWNPHKHQHLKMI